jgi:hypothetical protein
MHFRDARRVDGGRPKKEVATIDDILIRLFAFQGRQAEALHAAPSGLFSGRKE